MRTFTKLLEPKWTAHAASCMLARRLATASAIATTVAATPAQKVSSFNLSFLASIAGARLGPKRAERVISVSSCLAWVRFPQTPSTPLDRGGTRPFAHTQLEELSLSNFRLMSAANFSMFVVCKENPSQSRRYPCPFALRSHRCTLRKLASRLSITATCGLPE